MRKSLHIFLKVLGFLGSLLLTIFAGAFGFLALVALFESISEPSVFSFIGCVGCAFAACVAWSIRKDVLL